MLGTIYCRTLVVQPCWSGFLGKTPRMPTRNTDVCMHVDESGPRLSNKVNDRRTETYQATTAGGQTVLVAKSAFLHCNRVARDLRESCAALQLLYAIQGKSAVRWQRGASASPDC